MSLEYDPVSIAIEELKFCKKLGVDIVGWEIGICAFQAMASLSLVYGLDPMAQGHTLLGLPLYVNATGNPWTIASIKRPDLPFPPAFPLQCRPEG